MSDEPQKIELTAKIIERDQPKQKSLFARLLTVPVVMPLVSILLTSFIAPYIVEYIRKQEQIRKTQFETVEHISRILWTYRTAADFLVYDFMNGQPDPNLLKKHIDDYQAVVEKTSTEFYIEAFRARMYFQNEDIYNKLINTMWSTFNTDLLITKQLISQQNQIMLDNPDVQAKWKHIDDQLDRDFETYKNILNELFTEIGG